MYVADRVMLMGSGELGKEVTIALQRLGCEVCMRDRGCVPCLGAQKLVKLKLIAIPGDRSGPVQGRARTPGQVLPFTQAVGFGVQRGDHPYLSREAQSTP